MHQQLHLVMRIKPLISPLELSSTSKTKAWVKALTMSEVCSYSTSSQSEQGKSVRRDERWKRAIARGSKEALVGKELGKVKRLVLSSTLCSFSGAGRVNAHSHCQVVSCQSASRFRGQGNVSVNTGLYNEIKLRELLHATQTQNQYTYAHRGFSDVASGPEFAVGSDRCWKALWSYFCIQAENRTKVLWHLKELSAYAAVAIINKAHQHFQFTYAMHVTFIITTTTQSNCERNHTQTRVWKKWFRTFSSNSLTHRNEVKELLKGHFSHRAVAWVQSWASHCSSQISALAFSPSSNWFPFINH